MTEIESADRVERRKLSSRFRRRAALIALSEFGLVVGAVAVFFVFLTVLIRVYFPQGTSLGENQSWSLVDCTVARRWRCRSRVQLDIIIIRRDLCR
jgi:hypothetical protein